MRDNMIYKKENTLQYYMGYFNIDGYSVKVYALSTIKNSIQIKNTLEMLFNLSNSNSDYIGLIFLENITGKSKYKEEILDAMTFCGYHLDENKAKEYNTEWSIPSNCIISATLMGYDSGDEATANPYTKRLFLS